MTSKQILFIHTTIFALFVAGSISAAVFVFFFPGFFSSWYYLPSVGLVAVFTAVSWKLYGGCPFTVWENRRRESETPRSAYLGSCLAHYSLNWFGVKPPQKFFDYLLRGLLLLPIASGVLSFALK